MYENFKCFIYFALTCFFFFNQYRECWENNTSPRCHHQVRSSFQSLVSSAGSASGCETLVCPGWILQPKSEQSSTLFFVCMGKCFVLMYFVKFYFISAHFHCHSWNVNKH